MNGYISKVKASGWKNCEDILDKGNYDIIFDKIAEGMLKHMNDHPNNQAGGSNTASSNKITISKKTRSPTLYTTYMKAWFEENAPDKDDEVEHEGETYKRKDYFNQFIWAEIKNDPEEKKKLEEKYGITHESKGNIGASSGEKALNPLQVFDKVHRPLFPEKVEGLKNPDDGAKISLYRAIQIVWKELRENKEYKDVYERYKDFSDGQKKAFKEGKKFDQDLSSLDALPKEVFLNMDYSKIK
jgi:hypothetical protein